MRNNQMSVCIYIFSFNIQSDMPYNIGIGQTCLHHFLSFALLLSNFRYTCLYLPLNIVRCMSPVFSPVSLLSVYPSVLINVSVSPRSISMSKERCVLSFGTIIIIGLVLWSKLMFIQSVMFDWTIKRCAACWLQSFECPEVLPKAFALKNVTLQPSVVRFWLAKACSAILNRELAIRSESEQPMTCFMMDIGLWSH